MNEFSLKEFEADTYEKWASRAANELSCSVNSLPMWHLSPGNNTLSYVTDFGDNKTKTRDHRLAQKTVSGFLNLPYLPGKDFASITKSLTKIVASGGQGGIVNLSKIGYSQQSFEQFMKEVSGSGHPIFLELSDFKYDIHFGDFVPRTKCGIMLDPLAIWQNFSGKEKDYISKIAEYCKTSGPFENLYPLHIQTYTYGEAGADSVQELALILSTFVYYIDLLTNFGVSAEQAVACIAISISVGTRYFEEIAKMRSIRVLLRRIAQTYEIPAHLSSETFIHCRAASYCFGTSPHQNLIRTTIATMAAVIGGCDALTAPALFDGNTKTETLQSVGDQIPLILFHEAKATRIGDPLAGSYHVEILTDTLTESTWEAFLAIESKGGVRSYFESGVLRRDLDDSYIERLKRYVVKKEKKENVQALQQAIPILRERLAQGGDKNLIMRNLPADLEMLKKEVLI